MPVRKHRHVEDVEPPPPVRSAAEGLAAACALSELSAGVGARRRAPRGVRRFRSVEEADAHRAAWESGHLPAEPDGA